MMFMVSPNFVHTCAQAFNYLLPAACRTEMTKQCCAISSIAKRYGMRASKILLQMDGSGFAK